MFGNHGNHGQPGFMIDDDFIMGTDLGDHINEEDTPLLDEVEVLNSDRLVLIKIYTNLIKLAIDEQHNQTDQVHMQFSALNLLDNLFSNLLPIPSLSNMIIKFYTNSLLYQVGSNGARPRIMSNSVLSSSAA